MDTLLIIANLLGYLGLTLLFIQIVFGTRHIFKYFTTDTVLINKIHSYIGKYGMVFVFLHPIAEMFVRWEDVLWIFTPSFITETEFHITLGRFALVLTLIVWITSAIVRSKIQWRPWKYIHLLSYPILFFSFIHVKDIGTFYNDYLVVKFLWIFTFIIFLLASIYRLFVWAGMFKTKFKLIEKN